MALIQMQKLTPQQAGGVYGRRVGLWALHMSATERLQVRGSGKKRRKQLRKMWPAGAARGSASSQDQAEAPVISAAHHHPSLSLSLSLRTRRRSSSVSPCVHSCPPSPDLVLNRCCLSSLSAVAPPPPRRQHIRPPPSAPLCSRGGKGVVNNTVTSRDKMREIWKRGKLKRIIWVALIAWRKGCLWEVEGGG